MRLMANCQKVFKFAEPLSLTNTAIIFAEDNVEHPVQSIFNVPMVADSLGCQPRHMSYFRLGDVQTQSRQYFVIHANFPVRVRWMYL